MRRVYVFFFSKNEDGVREKFEQIDQSRKNLISKIVWSVRANRPISISSVPVSEGIEIRQGCQFISSLVGAWGKLPGGVGRFLPCRVGTRMCRLRLLFARVDFSPIQQVQQRSFWVERSSSATAPRFFPNVFPLGFT